MNDGWVAFDDVSLGEVTMKYYYFNPLPGTGGQRVAMRRNGVLQYILTDHLGSTSLVLNDDGTVHSQARCYPYGEERWRSGTLPTEVRSTGQREEASLQTARRVEISQYGVGVSQASGWRAGVGSGGAHCQCALQIARPLKCSVRRRCGLGMRQRDQVVV
jgi:hypothetical protein